MERCRWGTARLGHPCRPTVPRIPGRIRGDQMGSRSLRIRFGLAIKSERASKSTAPSRASYPRALRRSRHGQSSKLANDASGDATTEFEIPIDRHSDQRWPYFTRLLFAAGTYEHDCGCLEVGDRCCHRRLYLLGLDPIAYQRRRRMDRGSGRGLLQQFAIFADISRKARPSCRFSPCLWYNNGIEPLEYFETEKSTSVAVDLFIEGMRTCLPVASVNNRQG